MLPQLFYKTSLEKSPSQNKTISISSIGTLFFRERKISSNKELEKIYSNEGLSSLIAGIDGEYALLIKDGIKQKVYLITDFIASHTLYIYWNKATKAFCCANTIKAITNPFKRELELNWSSFNLKNTAAPFGLYTTPVDNVYRLRGGMIATLNHTENTFKVTSYTPPDNNNTEIKEPNLNGYIDLYRDSIEQAIIKRISGHSQILVPLSGGLDSSIIYSIAAQHTNVDAASICTVASLKNKEIDRARELTSKHHSNHLIFPVSFSDKPQYEDWIKLVITTEELGLGFEEFLKSQLINRAQLEFGSTLLISGTGSDQFNGGTTVTDYAAGENNPDFSSFITNMMHKKWKSYQAYNFTNFFQFSYHFSTIESRENAWPFNTDPWNDYLNDNYQFLEKNNVHLENKLTLNNNLSIQFPFLDTNSLHVLNNIPEDLQHDLFYNKQILRKAFKDLLPASFQNKPKFVRIQKGKQKMQHYLNHLVFGNNYGLLKTAFDASPQLRKNFSIDKIIAFLNQIGPNKYFPAFDHILDIINIGILDAHLFENESFNSGTKNSNYSQYSANDKSFDRKYLEKIILKSEDNLLQKRLIKSGNITIFQSLSSPRAYTIKYNHHEYIEVSNQDIITILDQLNGEKTLSTILTDSKIALNQVEQELLNLYEKEIILSAQEHLKQKKAPN